MMEVNIVKLRESEADALVFDAEDQHGPLEVRVPHATWEDLRAEAPVPCDAEDQRDYALGMIEARAGELTPAAAMAGAVRTIKLD